MSETAVDPVCAFHGKRWSEHEGGRCLYCCICYAPLTPAECAEDGDGQKWDVCRGRCAVEAGLGVGGAAAPAIPGEETIPIRERRL